MLRIDALPREQETFKFGNCNGLDFRPQTIDGQPMNPRQQPPLAPFQLGRAGTKLSPQDKALPFQREQGSLDFCWRQLE